MNLSAASLLLLATIPGALSANKVCHLFIYVVHIMCSFGGVGDGEAYHIGSVSIVIALVHDDDDDLVIAICYCVYAYHRGQHLGRMHIIGRRCATRYHGVYPPSVQSTMTIWSVLQ